MRAMRTLVLRKETLADLTVEELQQVVGGEPTPLQTRVYTLCTDPLSLACQSWHTEEC
jgi:hypothetical protein